MKEFEVSYTEEIKKSVTFKAKSEEEAIELFGDFNDEDFKNSEIWVGEKFISMETVEAEEVTK